jgi:hypothetical protein
MLWFIITLVAGIAGIPIATDAARYRRVLRRKRRSRHARG